MAQSAKFRRILMIGTAMLMAFAPALAHASSATLLLEEPYGRLGFFTGVGHAAVYLSGVCAETPVKLRACRAGETGVVVSRYKGVGGYDWLAVPLIPYLYAVENPEDVPLFADAKMVGFLRDAYRRRHLEFVAQDLVNDKVPGGNWTQLVGSAYDRNSYGFEVETSAARDADFIAAYNDKQNRSHFHTVYRNCADFAKDVMNFYYPRALRRSIVADLAMSTPKQMADRVVKFGARHEELEFRRYVIPQMPGTLGRSTAAHGVVESFFKSKKYIVPSALVSPIFAGSVAAVYLGTRAQGGFDPTREPAVYSPMRALEKPVGDEDRRALALELKHVEVGAEEGRELARELDRGKPGFDLAGRPVVWIESAGAVVSVGMARGNVLQADGRFGRALIEMRLREELKKGNPAKASESDVEKDWGLLQSALQEGSAQVAKAGQAVAPGAGNRR